MIGDAGPTVFRYGQLNSLSGNGVPGKKEEYKE